VAPIHPISIHCIIGFGGNARVLTQAATEAKTSSRAFQRTLVNLVCLTGESRGQHFERLRQAIADM